MPQTSPIFAVIPLDSQSPLPMPFSRSCAVQHRTYSELLWPLLYSSQGR